MKTTNFGMTELPIEKKNYKLTKTFFQKLPHTISRCVVNEVIWFEFEEEARLAFKQAIMEKGVSMELVDETTGELLGYWDV